MVIAALEAKKEAGNTPLNLLFALTCAEEMGFDGAKGLLDIKNSGAFTVAQDEASSVVWGMPGEAVKQKAVDKVLPLSKVHLAITNHFH